MDANTGTLIIGLAGIAATSLSSGLGLYFVARARRSPMRELLYSRQLGLVVPLLRTVGRIRVLTTILVSEDGQFKEEARSDVGLAVQRLSELSDSAAALLPTQLFAEVRRLSALAVDVLVNVDAGRNAASVAAQLDAQAAKTALMARALLGVDELSDESMALFAEGESLQRLSSVGLRHFRRLRSRARHGVRAV